MQPQDGIRINKYLAEKKYATRKGADDLIRQGRVLINGKCANLGDKVFPADAVEVRAPQKRFRYAAYHKPRGVITHSAQAGETDIAKATNLRGLFPVGRLDKDSSGLIILTDDGRLTEALLNPEHAHEKEYDVRTSTVLPKNFKRRMERGLDIGGYRTKKCAVEIFGDHHFAITLTEGKKHQIRRMCGNLGQAVSQLKRTRIMTIKLGAQKPGAFRALQGAELREFLASVGL